MIAVNVKSMKNNNPINPHYVPEQKTPFWRKPGFGMGAFVGTVVLASLGAVNYTLFKEPIDSFVHKKVMPAVYEMVDEEYVEPLRNIYDPKEVRKTGKWAANCDLQYEERDDDKKVFEAECWFNDGRKTVTGCDFPNATETGTVDVDPFVYISQFATYRGEDALDRLKEDFDDCPQLDSIMISGKSTSKKVNGLHEFTHHPVPSPWTLEDLTEPELQKIANHFDKQKFAPYRTLMGM
ncbi:hypothetical protein HOD66_04980 [Candidatus Woesearchaeota archaeon]|jgi:hypothetical protein|nr:hypothetical protein [Candidatus Woesearchaeota archaeon]